MLPAPDTAWTLTSIGTRAVPPAYAPTLTLSGPPSGPWQLSGQSGCNLYRGEQRRTGERVKVSKLVMTRRACEPAQMNLESEFIGVLEGAERTRLSGNTFTLWAGDRRLVFRQTRSAPAPTPPTVSAADLNGRDFALLSVGGTRPRTEQPVTLIFTSGGIGGYDGCNDFGAAYTTGKGGELLLTGPLTSTAVACTWATPDLTRMLGERPRITLSGKTLTLSRGGVDWVFEEK